MLEDQPSQFENDVGDTLEEYYMDLVTEIHRKEERELLAHPDRVSERLRVLSQFSNEVLNVVARVLDRSFRARVPPAETDPLDLDEFVDTSNFSDEPTPNIGDVHLGPMLDDTEISRDKTSTYSLFTSRLSSPDFVGHESGLRTPTSTLDPRSLSLHDLLEDQEQPGYHILTDPIESVISATKYPKTTSSGRRRRPGATVEENRGSARGNSAPNRRLALPRALHRNVRVRKCFAEDVDIHIRVAEAIGSHASLRQLKDILKTIRSGWSSTQAPLPKSTGGLWRYLHTLDATSHSNSLRQRIALYHLKLHHDSRFLQLQSCRESDPYASGDPRTEVLDIMIRETVEPGNEPPISGPPLGREALKDKIHRGKIWQMFCEKFSPGILCLIPISETPFHLSNSAIEKMTISKVEACLTYISEHREDIVRQAAAKATAIMPLFEGRPCKTILKLEDEGPDQLPEDMNDSSRWLELLDPKFS